MRPPWGTFFMPPARYLTLVHQPDNFAEIDLTTVYNVVCLGWIRQVSYRESIMWNTHFKPKYPVKHIDQTYEVSPEMRRAFSEWIAEHYGIARDFVKLDQTNVDHALYTLTLGVSGTQDCHIECCLHFNGKVESTLIPSNDKRIPLPSGELPPDKETFAVMVCNETCQTWRHRPLGWHSGYREMLECLRDIAKTYDAEWVPDVLTVAGFYPDGENLPNFATHYPWSVEGLREALTHARAMLKGGQEYLANTPIEYDEGNFLLTIFPGEIPPGEWLVSNGLDYSEWVADMPVTHPNEGGVDRSSSKVRRWANVMPLLDD